MMTSDEKSRVFDLMTQHVQSQIREHVIRCVQDCGGLDRVIEMPRDSNLRIHFVVDFKISEIAAMAALPAIPHPVSEPELVIKECYA